MIPFRHSAVFLIGLFPVVVIIWAWTDSMQHFMDWRYQRAPVKGPYIHYWIQTEASKIWAGSVRAIAIAPEPTSAEGPTLSEICRSGGFRRLPAEIHPNRSWFPPVRSVRNTTEYSLSSRLETRSFVIPHWLILACYLPFWIGLSLWDVRRIKRRIAAANPPIPE